MKLWDDELESYRAENRSALIHLPDPPSSASAPSDDPLVLAETMRRQFADLPVAPPSELAEESSIPGPAGDVPVRIFRPDGPARGLYLHLHGGGWILGSPLMGDVTNEHLARDLGLAVVSVDYRLAPEHPYPAGPDDCEAAARWLLEKGPSEFGAERMLIGGESAGGHLSLVTGLRVRDRLGAADKLLGLNLVFGCYDINGTPSQRDNGGYKDMLTPAGIRLMVECFTPGMNDEQRRDPDLSPLFADLAGLPPCLVTVGSYDHLLDDSLFIAPRLANADVQVELQVFPDSPHGFMALPTQMTHAYAKRTDAWLHGVVGSIT